MRHHPVTSDQNPFLGQIQGLVAFRNQHNGLLQARLLKMIENKEKHPKTPKIRRIWAPKLIQPLGLVVSSPIIIITKWVMRDQPRLSQPSPPIWGTVIPTLSPPLVSYPAGSLLRALSGLDLGTAHPL